MVRFKFLVLISSAALLAGCGGGKPTGHGSPEEAFKAACDAFEAKQWKTGVECLTPDSRDEMAGAMVFMAAMMSLDPEKGPDLEKILKKHAGEGPKAEAPSPLGAGAGPDFKKMAEPIKDKAAFIADMMDWMMENAAQAGNPMDFSKGRLAEVKIDGDTATAVVLTDEDGQQQKQPIEFKKIDGGWYVHVTSQTGP